MISTISISPTSAIGAASETVVLAVRVRRDVGARRVLVRRVEVACRGAAERAAGLRLVVAALRGRLVDFRVGLVARRRGDFAPEPPAAI